MRLVLVVVAVSLAVTAARAEGPVTTTSSAEQAPPQPRTAAPPLDGARDNAGSQRLAMGPCGPQRVKAGGKLERAPHGLVEVGVGAHGYRRLAGAVCEPIGQDAAVALSASVGQAEWGRR